MSRLQGFLLLPLLLISAFMGSLLLLVMAIACISVGAHEFYRTHASKLVKVPWFTFAAALLELSTTIEVEAMDLEKRTVLLCNHNNRVDWMFFWCLIARCGRQGDLCILLKDSLKEAPFFGWAMQAFCFVFLSRRSKDVDLAKIAANLAVRRHENLVVLVYPEGTDLSSENVKKSQAFGKTLDPPFIWSNVLIPKPTGARMAIHSLEPDAVYDLTVKFHSDQRPTEDDLLFYGIAPSRVQYQVQRYDKVPGTKDDFDKWLKARWARKEDVLSSSDFKLKPPLLPVPKRAYTAALIGWPLAMVLFFTGLWYRRDLRLATLVLCVLWHLITNIFGGLDAILLAPAIQSASAKKK